MFRQRIHQRRFDNVLHRRINRQHHVQTVARMHIFIAVSHQFARLPVRFRHLPARHPVQFLLHRKLDAIAPGNLRRNIRVLALGYVRRIVEVNPFLVGTGKHRMFPDIPVKRLLPGRQPGFIHPETQVRHHQRQPLPRVIVHPVDQPHIMRRVGHNFIPRIPPDLRQQGPVQAGFIQTQHRGDYPGQIGPVISQQRRIHAHIAHPVAHAHEADHLRRQVAVRINPLRLRLRKQRMLAQILVKRAVGAVQFGFIHPKRQIGHHRHQMRPVVLGNVFGQSHVMQTVRHRLPLGVAADPGRQFFHQVRLVQIQERRHGVGHHRLVAADLIGQQGGIGANRFHRDAGG